MQLLALILAVFFPLVSDSGNSHRLAAIPSWSYSRKYYYMEEWEALQGNIRLVAIFFIFVMVALLVYSLLRNQQKLCAVGTLISFVAYALIFLFMVNRGFVNPHGTYTFGLTLGILAGIGGAGCGCIFGVESKAGPVRPRWHRNLRMAVLFSMPAGSKGENSLQSPKATLLSCIDLIGYFLKLHSCEADKGQRERLVYKASPFGRFFFAIAAKMSRLLCGHGERAGKHRFAAILILLPQRNAVIAGGEAFRQQ